MTPASADTEDYLEYAWLFQTPTEDALEETKRLTDRALEDEDYMPSPFPEHLLEDHEWTHILAALDTCTISQGPQFCDSDGNDIIPIRMVNLRHYVSDIEGLNLLNEAVSMNDLI